MENETIKNDIAELITDVEEQHIISVEKFVLLSVLTLGLYEVWWMYKAWRFFQQQEKSDISPAARAIFSLFFLYSLMEKILEYAKEKGYSENYSVIALFLGYIAVNLVGYLPDPFWICCSLSVIVFIPPLKALNYAKSNSKGLLVTEQTSFNTRQTVLLVIGAFVWGCILWELLVHPK